MLRILIIFLVLVAGLTIGPILAGNQGIAFFQFAGYRIRMSLNAFILLEIFSLLLIYTLYWVLKKIFYTRTAFGNWLRSKSPKRANKQLEQAQLSLLEGDYQKASKLLAKNANMTHSTLTYLQAAQTKIDANQLRDARELLDKASKTCQEKEKLAFKLVLLRLQIKCSQYDIAKKSVEKLLDEQPRHPEILRLANQLYHEMKDYQSIIDILSAMYKTNALDEAKLDRIKKMAYINRIKQLGENQDIAAFTVWWKTQPKIIRQNSHYQHLVKTYLNEPNPSI